MASSTSRVSIAGGGEFAVRRVYCVGRNYWAHAVEMEERGKALGIAGDPREAPFFFQKSSFDAVVDCAADIATTVPYPSLTSQLEFEVEVVVGLVGSGSDVPVDEAAGLAGYVGVGCDLTRRDLQTEAKAKRRPWDAAKSFDFSAPCGQLVPLTPEDLVLANPEGCVLELAKNGHVHQRTTLDLMIFSVAECIAELSKEVALKPGDLIFTGTPAGVNDLKPGDDVLCSLYTSGPAEEKRAFLLPSCHFSIGNPRPPTD